MIRTGQRWAKVTTNKRGVTMVKSRTVLEVVVKGGKLEAVIYTPKRVRCRASYWDWRKWAKDARLCKS